MDRDAFARHTSAPPSLLPSPSSPTHHPPPPLTHPQASSCARSLALSLMLLGDLKLDALVKDHAVCSAVIAHLQILERVVYQQCTLGQPPLSVPQRTNRQNVRSLLDRPGCRRRSPHQTGGFTLQQLDLAHTWSERSDTDILALAAAVYMFTKMDDGWARQPRYPRALPELLTAGAELLTRYQRHNSPVLHSAGTVQQVTRAEFHILDILGFELATPTPVAWIQIFRRRLSLWEEQQLVLPQHPDLLAAPPTALAG